MASVFTKIVNGDIPAYKVAEDDSYLAFLDAFPTAIGHILVIPKKEVDYLFELDDNTYAGLMAFAKKTARGLKKAVPCKRVGMMVLGLDVPHAHVHLVPMQSEKDLLNFSEKIKLTDSEFADLRDRIAAAID